MDEMFQSCCCMQTPKQVANAQCIHFEMHQNISFQLLKNYLGKGTQIADIMAITCQRNMHTLAQF